MPGEITTPEPNQTVLTKGKGKAVEEEEHVTKSSSSAKLSTNEYQLKAIEWAGPEGGETRKLKIITQNENGPCPLLALCNVLILRGSIEIKPYDRSTVTYDFLVELLGDYLFKLIPDGEAEKGLHQLTIDQPSQKSQSQQEHSSDLINGIDENQGVDEKTKECGHDSQEFQRKTENDSITQINKVARPSLQDYQHTLHSAISIIPILQSGLDVNVRFNSIHGFEPTAELSVFDIFGVELVHGWVVDPQDEETWEVVIGKCGSYNKAVECVVGGDSVSKGVVLESSDCISDMGFDKSERSANAMENVRVRDALITSQFLDASKTQLTYHGLLTLSEALPPGNLCVFFRNNHFSTLYKHPQNSTLYILVTDAGFVNEHSVVWESLIDVDQSASEFVNGQFRKGEITGGDYVGVMDDELHGGGDQDYALALSLQQQEEEREAEFRRKQQQQRQEDLQRQQRRQNRQYDATSQTSTGSSETSEKERKREKRTSCFIS
ncbi:25573_t:CDS:2 [Dentiscutata erythropus]|uniref:25573_t:CDS:1 n=1 Tax=Dentiscutata erythropus TaxID=1348616 RepID=A0A9N9I3G0_9GLOM|nr:25573_t:CDS:2 [Dentiscutata erythropus]